MWKARANVDEEDVHHMRNRCEMFPFYTTITKTKKEMRERIQKVKASKKLSGNEKRAAERRKKCDLWNVVATPRAAKLHEDGLDC